MLTKKHINDTTGHTHILLQKIMCHNKTAKYVFVRITILLNFRNKSI